MNRFGHFLMLLLQKIGIYIIVNMQYTKNLNKGYKPINYEKDLQIYKSQFPLGNLYFHKFLQKRTSSQLISLDGFHTLLSLLYPVSIGFDFIDCYIALDRPDSFNYQL